MKLFVVSIVLISLYSFCYNTQPSLFEIQYSVFGQDNETTDSIRNANASRDSVGNAKNDTSVNNTQTLFSRGLALSSLGRYEEAIKYYDKVLRLNPNHID
jgi:tetratricopeptide (TPR) repeat protein